MAIVFDSEGGFREVPNPPPPKRGERFSGKIFRGPSLAELFKALKSYPARSVDFEFAPYPTVDQRQFIFLCWCKVFVYEIGVLLAPTGPKDEKTIDQVKNEWSVRGFVSSPTGFKPIHLCYNTKTRTGRLSASFVLS